MSPTIEQRVSAILSNQLGIMIDDIKTADYLVTNLGADSLDLVEIIMYCEEDFNIEISDAEADSCGTVGELIALIEKKGGA